MPVSKESLLRAVFINKEKTENGPQNSSFSENKNDRGHSPGALTHINAHKLAFTAFFVTYAIKNSRRLFFGLPAGVIWNKCFLPRDNKKFIADSSFFIEFSGYTVYNM